MLMWLLGTLTGSRSKPGAAARESAPKEAAPQRRRWALALADILARRHALPVDTDTLDAALPDDARQRLGRQVQRELGLPDGLPATERDRLAAEALRHWVRGLGQQQAHFYNSLAEQGRVRDALAFDCARTAFLIRCMALLGWVDQPSAWTVLLLNAQRAQDSFDSWADFGLAYARARQHWLTMQTPDKPVFDRATLEVQAQFQAPDSSWVRLPWRAWAIFDPQPPPGATDHVA